MAKDYEKFLRSDANIAAELRAEGRVRPDSSARRESPTRAKKQGSILATFHKTTSERQSKSSCVKCRESRSKERHSCKKL